MKSGWSNSSNSTPTKKTAKETMRKIKNYKNNIEQMINGINSLSLPSGMSDNDRAKLTREINSLSHTANDLSIAIRTNLATDLSRKYNINLSTPQFLSAANLTKGGKLKRGELNMYVAAFAWPDEYTRIAYKAFLTKLIKDDNFGSFALQWERDLDLDEEQYRADPAISWEMFENMWRSDTTQNHNQEYTEKVFKQWFEVEHLFKLGLCWKQAPSKRQGEYLSVGGLNLGIRRYFPYIFIIHWHRDAQCKELDKKLNDGNGMLPTSKRVAYSVEDYLQSSFLPKIKKKTSNRKVSPKVSGKKSPNSSSGGGLNTVSNVNERNYKWEYIFNRELDDVVKQIENILNKMKTQILQLPYEGDDKQAFHFKIKSFEIVHDDGGKVGDGKLVFQTPPSSQDFLMKISNLKF